MTYEIDYALKWSWIRLVTDAAILSYGYRWPNTIHQAIGNPRNRICTSGTGLDYKINHSTNQTYLYDNIQLYLYSAKYNLRELQKVTN